MKQYLTEILIVVCVILLLTCGFFYHGREKARNETEAARLEFAQYVVDQKEQHLKDIETIKVSYDKELQNEKQRAENIIVERDNVLTERDGLLTETARLRAYRNSATSDGCKAAINTIRVLTELLEEADRLAGVYAGNADENRNALLTCNRVYEALRIDLK